ncbi:MAG TPA: sigma-70 family RNA polymerase sigma factor [Streptosporangiaceae bacterium]
MTTFRVGTPAAAEDLLRELAPQVLGALLRRYGRFDECEDAVQEALLAAVVQWPDAGVPANPRSWLITVATRRLVDQWRADSARRNREVTAALMTPSHRTAAPAADSDEVAADDDTLTLLILCCHPDLPEVSRIALTLRAVGGLTTAEIARAFLVSEPTMAQRISRAKQQLRAAGARFEEPPPVDSARSDVLHVLYLIFNEGYTATSGPGLHRVELTAEAIRLTRAIYRLLPDDGEVAGLLALMLLTDARRPARCGPDGSVIPLEEQDRTLWDANAIREGISLISRSLTAAKLGPYQLQAAIAAVHAEASQASDTDWRQILALYLVLERYTPTPIVRLNRAVATAMVHGPQAGLDLLASVEADSRTATYHRLAAVRAHMLEMAGDLEAAQRNYLLAARRTISLPERRYLELRAARAGVGRRPTG